MIVTKEKETMKCPNCKEISFELRKAVITNSKSEIYAVCCVKCGTVLGMIKG